MIGYIRENNLEWLLQYAVGKKSDISTYNALMRLAQRFANRYCVYSMLYDG